MSSSTCIPTSQTRDSIILQHIHTVWKVFHAFDESSTPALLKAKYRWQVVTGPLQAPLQAYLFDISNGKLWKRTGYGGIPDCHLSLTAGWPEI